MSLSVEILAAIQAAEAEYKSLVAQKQRPKGKKRDWIGQKVGLKGRRVQDYLSYQRPHESKLEIDSSAYKNLENHLMHKLSTKVTIQHHKLTIYFHDCENLNELLRLLNLLYDD